MVHHDVVVWYDPDRHYTPVAQGLTISNTTVVQYEGSFFALRHQVEPLLERLDPPRLMVYVPLDQADAHHALVELETAGVVMKPGQQPPTRNTRLSLIARNALAPILGREKVMEIERQGSRPAQPGRRLGPPRAPGPGRRSRPPDRRARRSGGLRESAYARPLDWGSLSEEERQQLIDQLLREA